MSTSLPNNIDDLLNTTATELSFLIVQPEMPATLSAAFDNQQTTLALLREYCFIATGIGHLRVEIIRHRAERDSLFRTLMTNRNFQETILPILSLFRQQQENEHLPPYDTPSPESAQSIDETLTSISETSESESENTQLPDDSSPRTVEVHPHISDNESLSPAPETTLLSFHTANERPLGSLGSSSNPIDVDLIPDHLVRLNTGMRRSRSTLAPLYCQTCRRHGHTATSCIWYGPIVCGYCMEVGHGRNGCSTLRRDIAVYNPDHNFCMLCGQPGHTLVQCGALEYQQ
jgi:hypothetical protein